MQYEELVGLGARVAAADLLTARVRGLRLAIERLDDRVDSTRVERVQIRFDGTPYSVAIRTKDDVSFDDVDWARDEAGLADDFRAALLEVLRKRLQAAEAALADA